MIDPSNIPPPATATYGKHVLSRLNVSLIPTLPSNPSPPLLSPTLSTPSPSKQVHN